MNLFENTCPESEKQEVVAGPNEKSLPSEGMVVSEADQKREHRRLVHRAWVERNLDRRKKQLKEWYNKNRDVIRDKFRKWQHLNIEHRRKYKMAWARSHPDSVKRSNKIQFEKNKEQRREYGRKYNREHVEHRRKYAKAYHKIHYSANRDRLLAQAKSYAQSHPDIRRKCALNWIRNHPDKHKAHIAASHAKRKAAMRGATHFDPKANRLIRRWKVEKHFKCYYCGNRFQTIEMHVDHIIAITKGGKHEVGNLCRSCPTCNIRKRNNPVGSVVVNGQRFLNI